MSPPSLICVPQPERQQKPRDINAEADEASRSKNEAETIDCNQFIGKMKYNNCREYTLIQLATRSPSSYKQTYLFVLGTIIKVNVIHTDCTGKGNRMVDLYIIKTSRPKVKNVQKSILK